MDPDFFVSGDESDSYDKKSSRRRRRSRDKWTKTYGPYIFTTICTIGLTLGIIFGVQWEGERKWAEPTSTSLLTTKSVQINNALSTSGGISTDTNITVNDYANVGEDIIVDGISFINTYMNLSAKTGPAGTPGQNGSAIVPANYTTTFVLYVDKSGSDSLAVCSSLQPCLTINKALSLVNVSSPSTTSRFIIKVGPGRFDETGDIALTPWTWLVGSQRTATRVTSSTNLFRLDNSFANGNFRAGCKDILFSGSTVVTFNLQSIGGSGSTVIELQATFINNAFTFMGRNTADFVESWNSQFLSTVTLNAMSCNFVGNYIAGNLILSDAGATQSDTNGHLCNFYSGGLDGTITVTKTLDRVWRTEFAGISISASLTTTAVGGTNGNMTLVFDTISLPSTRTIGAYTTVTVSNPFNGYVYTKIGSVTLNSTGYGVVADSSTKSTTVITATAQVGTSPVGRLFIYSLTSGTGFTIASTSGASDANLPVGYIMGTPVP